ncbi:hypothetical protein CDEST_02317 [Colletotrichum destructivum]|uniref:Uncharacterized protein n=1 Tax=Colletotrichum destructivum TaxID=34406 RepID=A0AAX4I2V7_9PEZI|nr:hypothetical protein CDEST_02317 [Colletotrichum destructivum]
MAGRWLRQTASPARLLLVTSRWLIALPVLMTAFLMLPGTFLFPNRHRPTTLGVAMTDLAMVSYRGIPFSGLRGHDGPVMLFDFYWFPNAFGWECPYCPAHIQNGWYVHLGGVIYAGPRISFDPVAYMRQAADDMQMPNVIYDCVPLNGKVGHEKCDNSFFQAFADNYETRYKLKAALARFIWSIFALFYGSMVILNEWSIAYQPRRMKCACRWRWMKTFCAYPKGTDEEMEALGENAWDHVRLGAYGKAFVFFFISAFYDLWCARSFVSYLAAMDETFPNDQRMNPRLGRPFLFFSWVNVVMAGVATLLIFKRRQVTGNPQYRGEQLQGDTLAEEAQPLHSMELGDEVEQGFSDEQDEDDVLQTSSDRIRL